MALANVLVVCLLAVVVEGYVNFFPNYGFGLPPMSFMKPLPVMQPPRLPGPYQPPPLPEPPLLPVFGLGPMFGPDRFDRTPVPSVELQEPVRPVRYPTPLDIERGGSFSGFTVSSSNNGNAGVVIVTTNDNGKTQTFISPSSGDGQFVRIPSGPPATQTFVVPENRAPEFGPRAIEFFY